MFRGVLRSTVSAKFRKRVSCMQNEGDPIALFIGINREIDNQGCQVSAQIL